MRKHLATLLAAVASMIFAGAEARAVDIYVLTSNNSGGFNAAFGRIDSATGAYTSIASLSSLTVANLAWNPTAGNFFVTEDTISPNGPALRTLTTTGTLSGRLGRIGVELQGMAYRTANSTLYGFDWGGVDTGTVNPANGAWTILNSNPGVTSNNPFGGRYSIMNDTLYFAVNSGGGGFGTMGYTASSTYQQIVAYSIYANMVLANDGTTMYGIFGNGTNGQQRLMTINVNTGVFAAGPLITGTGLGTYFHGAGIAPVPEPSTYALGAIASGVMAYIARRRKARGG